MASVALDPIDTPVTTQPTSQASAFDTFTPFPRLPIELRLVIWKMALPRGATGDRKRMLCVRGVLSRDSYIFGGNSFGCKFRLATADDRLDLWKCCLREDQKTRVLAEAEIDQMDDDRDVRLLKTCWESRRAFLEDFSHVLPVHDSEYGQIRFNNESSVYVTNLFHPRFSQAISGAKLLELTLPDFKDVRSLVVILPAPSYAESCLGLLLFRSVDSVRFSLYPVTDLPSNCRDCEVNTLAGVDLNSGHKQAVESNGGQIAKRIRSRISNIDPDFQLPKFTFSGHCNCMTGWEVSAEKTSRPWVRLWNSSLEHLAEF